MKIRIVTPIISRGFASAEQFHHVIRPDTELSHVEIDHGPASIESAWDEMLATPQTVARIVEAERDGVDAAVINCMGDPGLMAAREPGRGPGDWLPRGDDAPRGHAGPHIQGSSS